MKLSVDVNTRQFEARLQYAVTKMGDRTRQGTEEIAKEIFENSQLEVPRDTNALASSGYYEVQRRSDTARSYYAYEAIIGYGNPANDPINIKSGRRASEYMVVVHENLDAYHPNGKAKFLEDPVREYERTRLRSKAIEFWNSAIEELNRGE